MVTSERLREIIQLALYVALALAVVSLGIVVVVQVAEPGFGVSFATVAGITTLTVSLILAALMYWLDHQMTETGAKMNRVLDSATIAIARLGTDGIYLEVNEAFASLLGRRPMELVGSHFSEHTHPEDVGPNLEALRSLVEGRTPTMAAEKRFIRADGHVIHTRVAANLLRPDDGGEPFLVTFVEDVSETRDLREEIKRTSESDPLTGLANRRSFVLALDEMLSSNREMKAQASLLLLDIDQFRLINDTESHEAGDQYLRQLAHELKVTLRTQDHIGRLDGDLFAVLLQDCGEHDAGLVAEKLRSLVESISVVVAGNEYQFTVSIGSVFLGPDFEGDSTAALRDADAACTAAKSRGRNRVVVHKEDDTQIRGHRGHVQHIQSLRKALENDEFELYAQSIEPIGDNGTRARHVEVLLRLRGEDGEHLPIGEIVQAAEQFHMAAKLDQWVVRNAVQWLSDNVGSLDRISMCAINLSGQSLSDERTLREISRVVRMGAVPPHKICFEITETAAVANLEAAQQFIRRLRRVGCRFSLDDFGTGSSSYGYLKELPVDFIKIDGAFVRNLCADESNEAIVKSIVSLAKDLGKRTIAEMVEEEAVMTRLSDFGVDYAQGYYVSRPKPIHEVLAA